MSVKKERRSVTPDNLSWYEKLVASVPGVERKGETLPYTSVNGNMFTFLSSAGILAIRMPEHAREAFLKKYKTKLMEAHGVVMKEYVEVPHSLLKKTMELKPYFHSSWQYAASLKQKGKKKPRRKGSK